MVAGSLTSVILHCEHSTWGAFLKEGETKGLNGKFGLTSIDFQTVQNVRA